MNNKQKFERIIRNLDVPAERKCASAQNAAWFLRHGIRPNCSHPDILVAIFHARRLAG